MKHEVRLENHFHAKPMFYEYSNFGKEGIATRYGFVGRPGHAWKMYAPRGNEWVVKVLDKIDLQLSNGYRFVHIGHKNPDELVFNADNCELRNTALWVLSSNGDLPKQWVWKLQTSRAMPSIVGDMSGLARPCPVW
jgi:hypothetical protein